MAGPTNGYGARKIGQDQLLSTKEVCDLLGIKRDSLYAMKDAGLLPFVRVGQKLIKFWRSDVQRYLDNNRLGTG